MCLENSELLQNVHGVIRSMTGGTRLGKGKRSTNSFDRKSKGFNSCSRPVAKSSTCENEAEGAQQRASTNKPGEYPNRK